MNEASRRVTLLAVALQAALLPLAGIPIWFRNEAPYHYVIARQTALVDSWRSYTEAINRPVVRVAEWAACHALGANATLHVIWNGVLFVLFALVLARLAEAIFDRSTGWLSVVALLAAFDIVFYPIYNAIHGVQYPLELLLVTGAILLLRQGLRGSLSRFLAGTLLALGAFLTHSMSVVVIPAAVFTMLVTDRREITLVGRRGWIALLVATPCALLLMPLVQSSGAPGGVLEKGNVTDALVFLGWRFQILAKLVMRAPAGPVLLWGALLSVARDPLPPTRTAAALAVALAVWGASAAAHAEWIALTVALATLAAAGLRRPRALFLVVWAVAGASLFVITREWSASYYRHLAVPAALLIASGFAAALVGVAAHHRAVFARSAKSPLVVALLSYAVVFAARGIPIPFVSPKVAELEYVKDLSFNFRDAVAAASAGVADGDTLLMYKGQSRDNEMESLYGEDYFLRLQPSKFPYYEWYFRLFERTVVVEAVEARAQAARTLSGRTLLAANAWEAREAAETFGLAPRAEFHRNRAHAAIFKE